ncbi:uncharacterized protein M6B38_108485 [Iris pallida]|uniref:Uncharacterized protein n=1 Tax=Iris pallida TaxID=29817 RepID=A0AAX6EHF8_IRIPA|nr:uncharacterized protein M6B38_108485 [Iris pallida]
MSHLGNLARNGELFPLTMLSWRKADKDTLEMIWSSVKENTNAPDGFKAICFTKMGISWKAFKHRVKDFYKKFETDAERLANVPPRVEPSQWPTLVAYWNLVQLIFRKFRR